MDGVEAGTPEGREKGLQDGVTSKSVGGVLGCLECAGCCTCLLLVLGPVLIVIGAVFLAQSATDGRGKRIDELNSYSAVWSNDPVYGIQGFQKAGAIAKFQIVQSSGANACPAVGVNASAIPDLILQAGSSSDSLLDGTGPTEVRPWQKARLSAFLTAAAATGTASPFHRGCAISVTWYSAPTGPPAGAAIGGTTLPLGRLRTLSQDDMGCIKRTQVCTGSQHSRTCHTNVDVSACPSTCVSKYYGVYSQSTCAVTEGLVELCIRATPGAAADPLVLLENNTQPVGASGAGCFWENGAFSTGSYRPVSAVNLASGWPVNIVLRSTQDPYLEYIAVTHGTGRFGLSRATRIKIGVSLLSVGLALMLMWISIFYCCYRVCCRRNKPGRPPGMSGYMYDMGYKYGMIRPNNMYGGGGPQGYPGQPMAVPVAQPYGAPPGYAGQPAPGYPYQPVPVYTAQYPAYPQPQQPYRADAPPGYPQAPPPQPYQSGAPGRGWYPPTGQGKPAY